EAPELPPGLRIPGVEAAEEAAAPAEAAVEEAAPAEAEVLELPPGLRIPGVEAAEEAAAPAEAVIEEAVPAEAEAPALPPGLEIPGVAAAEEAAAPAEAVIEEAAPAEAEAPELPPGLPIPGVETAEEAAAPAWAAVEEAAPAEAEAPALPPGLEIPGVAAAGEAVAPAEAEAPAPGLPIPPTEVPEEVPEEAAAAVVAETTPVEAEPPPVPAPPAWQAPAAPLPEEAAAPAEAAMLPTEAPTVPGVLAGVAALGAAAEAPPIPVAEEERPPEAVSAEPVAEPAREISEISERLGGVNLNTAKIEQLMTLDGVTLRIAKGIADYREKHGPFKSIWSLRSVPVIGRKTFKKITGMPYSAKGHERREKLAKMLKLPLPKMARVRNIAEAFAKQPGFTGCVICDRDGFLLAHGRSEEFADSLSAVAPQLFKKLAEYLESVDLQTVEAATFFAGDLPLTFVESGHICFVAVHQKRKVTMTQIRFAQRVVEELEWLLGRRGYIGLEE
ncbi:MAG: helix-hairpin-helix domain-containing protein, partial [Kiritimatiellae bacterium]|nr:helix-hairpin-helix domain-containing protein [Kiritimatiellia bacterium]